jgi:hypothetical protein
MVGGSFEKEPLYRGKIKCLTVVRPFVLMCLVVWSSMFVLIMTIGMGGTGPGSIITIFAPHRS